MSEEEESAAPRRLVHRVQAKCMSELETCRWHHQHESDREKLVESRRNLHTAVMAYWGQLKRFCHHSHAHEEWHQEAVVEVDGEPRTLEDLRALRFSTSTSETTEFNPETNSRQRVRSQEPWTMSIEQALAVYDQLDKVAHELGFDASPANRRDRYDYEQNPDPDENSPTMPNDIELPGGD